MRWLFVDRATAFQPWESISGTKAVTLEEYYLLEPLGREGALPESLVMASLVELARWLVAAASEFAQSALLEEIVRFEIRGEAKMSDVLELNASLQRRTDRDVTVSATATAGRGELASGTLRLRLVPLADILDPDEAEEGWRGLYVPS